jgi:Fusaric acid resistance protein-like
MGAILLGMAAGYGVARLLGWGDSALQAAVVASLTLAAGSSGRLRTSVPVAAILGGVVVVYSTLGALTTGHPVAAALAMALVAFTTSVMTAAQPVGLLIGLMASNAYFLVTGIGVLEQRAIGGSLSQIGLLGLVGLLTGLALVALRALVEQALGTAPPPGGTKTSPSLLGPMRTSVRTFDTHAKDGVRRAVALGIAMYAFQSVGTHNAFWVMLTVFVILAPNGRTTLQKAAIRVVGTLVGVLAVVALSAILPTDAALPLAVLALAISLAASSRSTTVSAAFGAAAAATLTAFPSGDFVEFASARLIDTLIGAALALAAGYLLWPRSRHLATAVPDDLTADASNAGVRAIGR